jgi:diphosphate-dependent phosphofructokinase
VRHTERGRRREGSRKRERKAEGEMEGGVEGEEASMSCFPLPLFSIGTDGAWVVCWAGKGLNSLMVSITGVTGPVDTWRCGGVPLTMMMNMERRKG